MEQDLHEDEPSLVDSIDVEPETNPHRDRESCRTECWRLKGFYLIICLVSFVQGGNHLSKLAVSYFYKDDLHLSPALMAVCSGITVTPWVIKPLYGFISDSFPIFERRRKPYFFIFGFFGCFCWMMMSYVASDVYSTVVVLFGASLSLAFVNVLAEALIVERGGEHKGDHDEAKHLISLFMTVYWGTESCAKLISGFMSGFLLERISKRLIFALTGLFPGLLCIVALFLHEKKTNVKSTVHGQWTRLSGHVGRWWIWQPTLFMFVWNATPNSQASYFYFLTNDLGLKPEFLGTLHVVEGLSSIMALGCYHIFLKSVSYRRIIYWTIVLSFVAGLSPLILVFHLNRRMGLGDGWFCVGDSALLAGVGQVAIMPLLILGAETCPKQIEGTLYALLMSTLNVGGVVSDHLGGLLTYLLGVTENNFTNLWKLVLICNICNLIPIGLIWLIPKETTLREEKQKLESEVDFILLLLEKCVQLESDPLLKEERVHDSSRQRHVKSHEHITLAHDPDVEDHVKAL